MSQLQQQHGQQASADGGNYVNNGTLAEMKKLDQINEKFEDPDMEYVNQLLEDENSNLPPASTKPHHHLSARKFKNDGNGNVTTTEDGSNSREVVARRNRKARVLESKESITSLISSPSPTEESPETEDEAYGVMVPVNEYHEDEDDQDMNEMLFGQIQTRSSQSAIMSRVYAFTWAEYFYTSVIPRFAAGILSYSFYSAVASMGAYFFSYGNDFANKYLHPGQLYPKEDIVRVGDYKVRVCGNRISLRAIFFNNEEPDTALRLVVQVPGLQINSSPEDFISTVLVEEKSWSCIFKEEKGLVQILFREGISPKETRFYPPGGNGLFTIDIPAKSQKSIH